MAAHRDRRGLRSGLRRLALAAVVCPTAGLAGAGGGLADAEARQGLNGLAASLVELPSGNLPRGELPGGELPGGDLPGVRAKAMPILVTATPAFGEAAGAPVRQTAAGAPVRQTAAVARRDAQAGERTAEARTNPPAAPSEPAVAAVVTAAGPLSPPAPRVFVHFSTLDGDGAETARRLGRHLSARGYAVADVRPVAFPIAAARVRFFFAGDRGDARRVTAALAEFRLRSADDPGPVRLEDYAHYRPLPQAGNVEVWLPSGSS